MEITIRNITKNIEKTIILPMDEELLLSILRNDEWIIIDSPVGTELTNIKFLNKICAKINEKDLMILSEAFLLNEIVEKINDYIIVDFTIETEKWNNGNGVDSSDWWKGYVLYYLGYEELPFKYTKEMEGYIKFEQLWYTAESKNWACVKYDSHTYLICL